MMIHGNKWGWRQRAARFLLAPLLTAGMMVPALAQTANPPMQSHPVTTTAEQLLRMGRTSLEAGQFDQARDFAKQALAKKPDNGWGYFSDSPESLLKDIAEKKIKLGKQEGEQLVKMAKQLLAQPVGTPAERMANLDKAYSLVDRAVAVSGAPDLLDGILSDTPTQMRNEIAKVRAEFRRTIAAAPNQSLIPTAQEMTPVVDAVKAIGTQTAERAKALKLMAEATALKLQNRVIEAKAKVVEAVQLNAPFAATESSPEKLLEELNKDAQDQLDKLVKGADEYIKREEFRRAETSLGIAMQIAEGMKLPTAPIQERYDALKAKETGQPVQTGGQVPMDLTVPMLQVPKLPTDDAPKPMKLTIPTVPSVGGPALPTIEPPKTVEPPKSIEVPKTDLAPVPSTLVEPPMLKPADLAPKVETPKVEAPATPVVMPNEVMPSLNLATPKAETLTGEMLLNQAKAELKRGDLEMARKLAMQAYASDKRIEPVAQDLLRQVDAEVMTRKKQEASESVKAANGYMEAKRYEQAVGILKRVDPTLLSEADRAAQKKMFEQAQAAMTAPVEPIKVPTKVETAKVEPIKVPATTVAETKVEPTKVEPAKVEPARAQEPKAITVAQEKTETPSTGLSDQVQAMGEVEYQKLRSEGLKVEADARDSFNKGETDIAIAMLTDYAMRVKQSSLSAVRQERLLDPIERRRQSFVSMKHQIDVVTSETNEKRERIQDKLNNSRAEQQMQAEIQRKVAEVQDLVKGSRFREAEALALQTKMLDPDNVALQAIYDMAKMSNRVAEAEKMRVDKEAYNLHALNDAEKPGPYVDMQNPLHHDVAATLRAMQRGDGFDFHQRTMTPAEQQIEMKLDTTLSVDFKDAPIQEVLDSLRDKGSVNISIDDASLAEASISLGSVTVTEKLNDLSLKSILGIVLEKARLKFIVEDDVIKVTTKERAKGRLYTKVFSVMDLVTPIPDFALADHQSVAKAYAKTSSPTPAWQANSQGGTTYNPNAGMAGGQMVSGPWNNNAAQPNLNASGSLDNSSSINSGVLNNQGSNPIGSSATLASNRANTSSELMRLITGIVRPYEWQELGGPGKLAYYDIGGALVVNQTADVIREVQDLLASLRRLQETSVAVEIRVISLSESFYERVGVDFALNIETNPNESFERSLTTGTFRPEPFINSLNANNVTVGYNPAAGGFTPDLKFPVRPSSFGFGIPPFGGYPGPNPNGGLSLGLAFLNDIQVYLFLEAAQGDRRVSVMQAPKITLFNGQTSTVFVSDVAFFTTGLQVINVGGQVIYIPQQVPIPIGNSPPQPGSGNQPGVSVTVQAIISADRRFVRMNLSPTLTALTSATVPLFPVTAFITPVFEGGSQGVPIPFTQFFQQPSLSEINVQTTVAVPDGGTVVLGGLKTLSEGRNEFGPPVLSQLPYVNRLFRNTGIGRETRHIMIMVTPRIIIQSEEEFNQTGLDQGGVYQP